MTLIGKNCPLFSIKLNPKKINTAKHIEIKTIKKIGQQK
jgi:hypothetical protein